MRIIGWEASDKDVVAEREVERRMMRRVMRGGTMRKANLAFAVALSLVLSACGSDAGEFPVAEEKLTVVQAGIAASDSAGAKSSAEYDKEESVYVKASASGEVREITVETRLKCTGSGPLEDYTILTDIKNTEGDEEFTAAEDGRLTWENHGADIQYEGKTAAQLPVTLKISYELDGKSVTPEELAGKSGRLRMRFDYENHVKEKIVVKDEEVEVCVPFVAFSMALLSEDHFSNIEVKNGKLLSMGEEKIAAGYAYPGLADSLHLDQYEETDEIEIPDYVEITADVTDFELEFTATVISPGTFEDMDMEGLDDVEDLIDSMDELQDASDELVDGTGELVDGADTFKDGLEEYVDAVGSVKEGTAAIEQGLHTLNKNKKSLLTGAESLQAGLEALNAAVSGKTPGGDTSGGDASGGDASDGNTPGEGGSGDGSGGDSGAGTAADLNAVVADMNARLTELEASVSSGDAQAQEAIAALKADMAVLSAYMGALSESAGAMTGYADLIAQLAEGSAQLTEGVKSFNTGVGKLYEGSQDLNEGVGELKDAGTELKDGYDELYDGMDSLQDGVKEFDEEGIQEITDLADEDLQDVVNRFRAVQEADGRYINFGGILPGKTGSVRFIIETEEIK